MSEERSYVRVDDHDVLRVADTHVMLDSVIASFQQGCSPETIRQQYPSLSLEQVYGAITYYLSHADEVNNYLHHQSEAWRQTRAVAEANPAPVVQRLRATQHARAA